MDAKACPYCKTTFVPNKYSPRQSICSNAECQKKRQLESMRLWRQKNPTYFKYDESKGLGWLEAQRKRSRLWRQKNPDKVRSYRVAHSEEYRRYMREYMRTYREKRRGGHAATSPSSPTPPPAPSQS